jgi:hypothetical protein
MLSHGVFLCQLSFAKIEFKLDRTWFLPSAKKLFQDLFGEVTAPPGQLAWTGRGTFELKNQQTHKGDKEKNNRDSDIHD